MHGEVTLASHFLWVAVLHTLQKEPTLSMFCRHTLHCRFFLKVFSLKTWGSPFPALLIFPLKTTPGLEAATKSQEAHQSVTWPASVR